MTSTTVSSIDRVPVAVGARISEIDMLRGFVIVLMALDHVRDYFILGGGFTIRALNPEQTTSWLYATRWVTHLCAPTFLLLAGVSAYLQIAKGKSTRALSLFLLTRGFWLLFLELTVLSFAWSFAFPYFVFLQVIWAIGWSMIALAALVWLPRWAVLGLSAVIIAGHNLLDPITPQNGGGLIWTLLHEGGPIFVDGALVGLVAYPLLPWIGIIALGYTMGALFADQTARRERTLFAIGLAMLATFLALRWFGVYGDPTFATGPQAFARDWREQHDLRAAIMVFLDVQKYPPSLQFVLVTLGLVLALWPILARLYGPAARVLLTFGAVPLFFYVLHIYLAHTLAIATNAMLGRDVSPFLNYLHNGFTAPERLANLGFPLAGVYLAWIVVLALLYPACRWWAQVKSKRRDWWLSYL